MKKKYHPVLFVAILLTGLSTVLFILKSNDHKECKTEIRNSVKSKGELLTVRSHVCMERFSF